MRRTELYLVTLLLLVALLAAWQRTGETWDGVELVLSTARPGRAASPPLLTDDVLALRKKTDEEKKRIVVEARDQAVAVAGLDRGARRVDEMPGVDDGGELLSFTPAQKVSIASDGRCTSPTRIPTTTGTSRGTTPMPMGTARRTRRRRAGPACARPRRMRAGMERRNISSRRTCRFRMVE